MLRHFNGAGLFAAGTGPSVSIFGISPIPSVPPLEWAKDWFIDMFTPRWRAGRCLPGEDRQNDWAIGMQNYGGLIIANVDGRVREWDTAQRMWDPRTFDDFDEWMEVFLREGDEFLREAEDDPIDRELEGDAFVKKVYLPRP
jgi:hypothetical protein